MGDNTIMGWNMLFLGNFFPRYNLPFWDDIQHVSTFEALRFTSI